MCETYTKGEGLSEIRAGFYMCEIDKTEDNPNAQGLAVLIHKKKMC